MLIRDETEKDRPAVFAVNAAAFGTPAEAELVDALREHAHPFVSLLADDNGAVVGHVMFTPVALVDHPELKLMGLAPAAVFPAHQRKGVGSSLVQAGLERCRKLGFGAVVVLGDPEYYTRFGFAPASHHGLRCEFYVPEEAFMVIELLPGYLLDASGVVEYDAVFKDL